MTETPWRVTAAVFTVSASIPLRSIPAETVKTFVQIILICKCVLRFGSMRSLIRITVFLVADWCFPGLGIIIKLIKKFTESMENDLEAIENAVSSPLSNGFVEGTNSKLKMIKRTMYGRCGCRLLAAKLMVRV